MTGAIPEQELDAFVQIFEASDWDRVEVVIGDWALRLAKNEASAPGHAGRVSVEVGAGPAQRPDWVEILAPHIATFRGAPAPGARVGKDTEICLLEVLRVATPLRAGVDGVLRRICVADGDLVEAGQPLFLVEPAT
jgi:biotin carboxyl carrier protein